MEQVQPPSAYNRLLMMGLLSKHPLRSKFLRRFLSNSRKSYTEFQIMQMIATYNTPGIPRQWLDYQFQRLGGYKPDHAMRKMRRFLYWREYNAKYRWLGERNVQYIGPDEVERYYLRRDFNVRIAHPNWAVAVMLQHKKNGISVPKIAEMYKLNVKTLDRMLYTRNIFEPYYLDTRNKTR